MSQNEPYKTTQNTPKRVLKSAETTQKGQNETKNEPKRALKQAKTT